MSPGDEASADWLFDCDPLDLKNQRMARSERFAADKIGDRESEGRERAIVPSERRKSWCKRRVRRREKRRSHAESNDRRMQR